MSESITLIILLTQKNQKIESPRPKKSASQKMAQEAEEVIKMLNDCLDDYEVVECSDTEYPEVPCEEVDTDLLWLENYLNTQKNQKIESPPPEKIVSQKMSQSNIMKTPFLNFADWFYMNECFPEVVDCSCADIQEELEKYEITALDEFVDDYLDDWKESQKKYFDVVSFIRDCLDNDDYRLFVNKGGIYKELNTKDVDEYVWMTEKYTDNGTVYSCKTDYHIWIVKEIN